MDRFKLNRSKLSGWYIAIMISFFVFNLTEELVVTVFATWMSSLLTYILNDNLSSSIISWLALTIVCLAIVYFIKKVVVEALNLFSNDEDYSWADLAILSILTLGFFVYSVNRVFDQPMPREIFSETIVKLLGGNITGTSNFPRTADENNILTVSPWLWTLGPLVFIWSKTVAAKFKSSPKSSKSDTIKHEMSLKM